MKKKTKPSEDKTEDYKMLWQRTLADFDNYKKRTEADKKNWTDQAKIEMLGKILPLLDNLTLMANHTPDELKENSWVKGVDIVVGQIESTLLEEGISQIKPNENDKFDPTFHEAVSMIPSDFDEGNIVKINKPGYKIGEKVIRTSQVIVSSGKLINKEEEK